MTYIPYILYPVFLGLMSVFFLICILLRIPFFSHVLDQPNGRSLHAVPVPRIGGIAIVIGVLVSWAVTSIWVGPILICMAGLATLSFVDDMKGLGIGWRFAGHTLAVISFVFWLPGQWNFVFVLMMILAMIWMINLYNFMDGSDGLAGGMALFGFGGYAAAAFFGGDAYFATQPAVVAAAALAFLWFNFHPARIFMGDVGSIPLGFLAGALGLLGWQRGDWPLWFPVLVFSPFIMDATITLLKRLLNGEKFWQAHRSHYYQRLIRMGWGHRKTAFGEYSLMVLSGGSAVWLMRQSWMMQVAGLVIWSLVYVSLALTIDHMWRKTLP
ncbi:MAG TPA: glycosyltransferase family 4 protein [Novimethylophilus sp.]|uniref:MraY family glycosyltransferase n=1 Tax=Novimethylophilus sp. TaxID=2137426 RepID=UPI002F3E3CE9